MSTAAAYTPCAYWPHRTLASIAARYDAKLRDLRSVAFTDERAEARIYVLKCQSAPIYSALSYWHQRGKGLAD